MTPLLTAFLLWIQKWWYSFPSRLHYISHRSRSVTRLRSGKNQSPVNLIDPVTFLIEAGLLELSDIGGLDAHAEITSEPVPDKGDVASDVNDAEV